MGKWENSFLKTSLSCTLDVTFNFRSYFISVFKIISLSVERRFRDFVFIPLNCNITDQLFYNDHTASNCKVRSIVINV